MTRRLQTAYVMPERRCYPDMAFIDGGICGQEAVAFEGAAEGGDAAFVERVEGKTDFAVATTEQGQGLLEGDGV